MGQEASLVSGVLTWDPSLMWISLPIVVKADGETMPLAYNNYSTATVPSTNKYTLVPDTDNPSKEYKYYNYIVSVDSPYFYVS